MSDSENFIRRWSRRKRKASDEKTPRDQTSPRQAASPGSPQGDASKSGQPAAAGPDIPEFDPASLPPVDAIKADTDITAFMRAGVPAELRHAALRRAWSADAAIRDFVGLNENKHRRLTRVLRREVQFLLRIVAGDRNDLQRLDLAAGAGSGVGLS